MNVHDERSVGGGKITKTGKVNIIGREPKWCIDGWCPEVSTDEELRRRIKRLAIEASARARLSKIRQEEDCSETQDS